MNLNFDKIKTKMEHGGNPWTSYSDLFLVLSVIFLLLYVMANLRASTASLLNRQVFKKTLAENESLKKQVSAYEVLKDDYVSKGASEQEVALYQQLMHRLDLLGEDTKEERNKLEHQAKELNEKEKALNNYQMLMKGIINANMISQARLKQKDLKIEERDRTIEEKDRNISDLSQAVAQKQAEISQREREISQNNYRIIEIQNKLEKSIQEARYAYRAKKHSQEALQGEISSLKKKSESQIAALRDQNAQSSAQLNQARQNVESKNRELERMLATLSEKEQQYRQQLDKSKLEHESKLAKMDRERMEFERELAAAKISADEKLKRQQSYLKKAEDEKANYNAQLKQAQTDLEHTQKNIKEMESNYQGSLQSLSLANQTLQKSLTESNAKREARKILVRRVSARLQKAGVGASVDPETGEVTVQFMDGYFDYGKAELKPEMLKQLSRLFPIYAAALFEDKNVAKNIATVDIIGFASPTFRGRFVDPESLESKDRTAVNFNMDLSYRRAKSIFEYVFDTRHMQYSHQKDLLPIVHVTGRSYLAERKVPKGRVPASGTMQDYCQAFDCQKSQKVIIKFNLRED